MALCVLQQWRTAGATAREVRRTPSAPLLSSFLRLSSRECHASSRTRLRPCRGTEGDGPSGPSDLESKFMEELRRRKMESGAGGPTPTPAKDPFATSTTTRPRAAPPPKVSMDGTEDQRQRSISMVNEGLEGLPGRASQLLQLGGSVFLAFLPFLVVISLLFSGVYFVFGESFVHRGTPNSGPPVYIDPEKLLSESTVDPYVPFNR